MILLGDGATSHVLRGIPAGSTDPVAIKLARSRSTAALVRRERALLRGMRAPGHPAIVALRDEGEHAGLPWFAMDLLGGGSLSDLHADLWHGGATRDALAAGGRLTDVLTVLGHLTEALAWLHRRGFVHADLAPGNVLFQAPLRPVLIDFGAAREQPDPRQPPADGGPSDCGTTGYVAPERLQRAAWDSRADLYALGCLAYELVTGCPVFTSDQERGLARQHQYARVTPPSQRVRGVPEALDRLILSLLAKSPHDRLAHAEDVITSLHALRGETRARPREVALFASRTHGCELLLREARRHLDAPEAQGIGALRAAAGAGLTRVLGEIARLGAQRGRQVVCIEPHGQAEAPPLSALRPLLALCAGEDAGEPPAALRAWIDPSASARAWPADASACGEVFGALWRSLERLAARRPLLITVDRAERAEPASRDFLRWLHAAPRLPATVVWVGRCEDDLALGAADLTLGAADLTLALAPLSYRASTHVVADMLGVADVGTRLADAAFHFARGSPRALVAFLCWAARDRIEIRARHADLRADSDAHSALADDGPLAPRSDTLLPAQHAALAAQLERAPDAAARQHEIGHHWARAERPDRAARALRQASQRAADRAAFDDAIEDLREALAHARRCEADGALARRTGHALLRLYSRAARHESVHTLGRELLDDAAPGSPLVQARVWRLMALSSRICGAYARAVEELDRAEDALARTRPRSIAALRERLEQNTLRARLHYVQADAEGMWRLVRAQLPVARAIGRPEQLAALYMDAANALVSQRRYAYSARAVRYQRRALALHRRIGARLAEPLLAQFGLAFMLLLGERPQWYEARALLEEAEREAPRAGDAALTCRITLYLAVAQRRLGERDACRELAERALQHAKACSLRGYMGAAHACLAWVELHAGHAAVSEQRALDACQLWWTHAGARSDAQRRAEYPFQWLALAPLLALLVDQERYDECEPLLRELLHPAYARLTPAVRAALQAARDATPDLSRHAQALEDAVALMRAAGFM